MRRAGLVAEVLPGDHTEEGGVRAGRRIIAEHVLPTAVVASNDRLAVGVMDAFVRAGVDVPGPGLGGRLRRQHAGPPRPHRPDLGQPGRPGPGPAAVQAAVSRLDAGRTERMETVLVPHLVVRGSTAPPRAG
jgi:DNA-binding LacI/PurR family transcriptional regulator